MNSNSLFSDMVTGKRVALVGPGRTSTDNLYYIENCDTVVRCGMALPVDPEYKINYGERTDIIYNALDNSPMCGNVLTLINLCKKFNVKLVCNAIPFHRGEPAQKYSKLVSEHLLVKEMSDTIYTKYENLTQSKPNTGFSALFDLYEAKPSELFIVGIDMMRSLVYEKYKTNTQVSKWTREDFYNNMKPGPLNHHNPDKQYKFFKQLATDNDMITVDPTIQEIFNSPSNDILFK